MQTSLGQGPDVYQVGHGVTRPDHRVDFPETAKLALAILRNLPLGDRETRSNLGNSGIEDGKVERSKEFRLFFSFFRAVWVKM